MQLSQFYPGMEGWTPVDKPTTANVQPQTPNLQTQRTQNLRTTQPLTMQYSGDTVKQYHVPGLSSFRIAPLGPNGNAAINAAATSAAVAAANSGLISNVSISLLMPPEFIVSGSPAGPTGTFDVAWKSELANTVLAGPISGNPDVPMFDTDAIAGSSTPPMGGTLSVGPIPLAKPDEYIVAVFPGIAGITIQSPFTLNIAGAMATYQATTDTTVAANFNSIVSQYSVLLASFLTDGSGTPPAIVGDIQSSVVTTVGPNWVMTTTNNWNVVAGDAMFVMLTSQDPVLNPLTLVDSQGNDYFQVGSVYIPNNACAILFVCPSIKLSAAPAALTFTLSMSTSGGSSFGATGAAHFTIAEINHLSPQGLSGIPTFRKLVGNDLPFPLPSGKGGVFAFTPIAHEFLTGLGTDGVLIAAQPAFTDISGIAQISQGGTGTATPALVAGAGIGITGSWPDNTISNTGVLSVDSLTGAVGVTSPDSSIVIGTSGNNVTLEVASPGSPNQSIRVVLGNGNTVVMSDDYWIAVDTNAPQWALPFSVV